jgi:four helix bundle protein
MELEEALYWLELLVETGHVSTMSAQPISAEIDQLIAIFSSLIQKWKPRK